MNDQQRLVSIGLIVLAVMFSAREYSIALKQQEETLSFNIPTEKKENPQDVLSISAPSSTPIESALATPQVVQTSLGSKQTLGQLLASLNVSTQDIERALKVLNPVCGLKNIQAKSKLNFEFNDNKLMKLSFYMGLEHIVMERGRDNLFHAAKSNVPVKLKRIAGKINKTLYHSLRGMNIKPKLMNEAILAMGAAVDISRIREGDSFILVIEAPEGSTNCSFEKVEAIAFKRGKTWSSAYRFEHQGKTRFLNAQGQSVSSSKLMMPISLKKVRISSRFGLRTHPIRGYTAKHKGIDLAAPTGTQVVAAADGVVLKSCYFGGYGKYILIQHSGGYSTAYAHLSQLGVKVGSKVKQGQLIGKVGTTGMSTGPHLHYEVHRNRVHINPLSMVALPNSPLGKQDLKIFKTRCQKVSSVLNIS